MNRKTKALGVLLGVTLLIGPGYVIADSHGLKKQVQQLSEQQNRTKDELRVTKVSLKDLESDLKESKAAVVKTNDLLETERMKTESLQKSLTDTQDTVARLREQKSQLQVENRKLNKAIVAKAPTKVAKPVKLAPKVISRGNSAAKSTILMRGTAYTNNDAGMNGKGITATGTRTAEGRTVAVDPRVIPLGTKLKITSASYPAIDGYYTAEDTGSAIKGNKIDMYFTSKSRAAQFGVRSDLVVTVLN